MSSPARPFVLLLILLLLCPVVAAAQGLPNERGPAARGAAVDPESGQRDGEASAESDDNPRAGMPSGQSNLPLPRFASLRASEVNMRTGPGVRYPIDWVFRRRALPIQIVAEFGTWRKIRDEQGTEGWVHRSMLSGKRTAVAMGKAGAAQTLRRQAQDDAPAVARIEPGVIGEVLECAGAWCRLDVQGFRGWLPRQVLWGVTADERIK